MKANKDWLTKRSKTQPVRRLKHSLHLWDSHTLTHTQACSKVPVGRFLYLCLTQTQAHIHSSTLVPVGDSPVALIPELKCCTFTRGHISKEHTLWDYLRSWHIWVHTQWLKKRKIKTFFKHLISSWKEATRNRQQTLLSDIISSREHRFLKICCRCGWNILNWVMKVDLFLDTWNFVFPYELGCEDESIST